MFQQQEPHHYFRWCAAASAGAALRPTFRQSLIHRRHQLLVLQHLVGVFHPLFSQIAYLFGDQAFAEVELLSPRLNHGESSSLWQAGEIASPAAIVCVSRCGSTWRANSQSPKSRPKLFAPV
jgi:hypothetical protein